MKLKDKLNIEQLQETLFYIREGEKSMALQKHHGVIMAQILAVRPSRLH